MEKFKNMSYKEFKEYGNIKAWETFKKNTIKD